MRSYIQTTILLCCGLLSLVHCKFSALTVQNPLDFVDGLTGQIESAQDTFNKFSSLVDKEEDYRMQIFLSGKKALLAQTENATQCVDSVVQMGKDLVQLEPYSLTMLDAWGKFPSGVAKGNLQWYGRYFECLEARTQTFEGKWCLVIVGSPDNAPFGVGVSTSMSFGSCFPDTCSDKDIYGLVQAISNETGLPVYPYCPEQPRRYKASDIIALIICSTLGFIIIVGTGYESYLTNRKHEGYDELLFDAAETSRIENSNPSGIMLSLIFQSFSVIKNGKAILDTSQKEGNITVLHGLRFISMTWVILGHSFIFITQYLDNTVDYAAYFVQHGSFQAVGNATFSVDTFFFLSGLLATYLGMREMERRHGKLNIGLAYLYRYLRLTPAYALCILLSVSLYGKMGDGPVWPAVSQTFSTSCQKYWWTNLLYINNIHPSDMGSECFAWGWYLANDMQFFLLSPFLLWILFRRPILGLLLLAFGVIGSIISTGVISAHYEEQPQNVGIGLLCSMIAGVVKSNGTLGVDNYMNNVTTPQPAPPGPSQADTFWSDIYTKPWCRMGVYFIGAATGYTLHAKKSRINMNKISAYFMWVLVTVTALLIIYGLNGSITKSTALSVGVAAFYNAVSRPLWAACLAWLVIACSSGYGGPINTFLSWKVFIPLSRLTYCAYLIHPMVIYWVYATQENLFHFSVNTVAVYFLGFVALSYALALALCLLIEMPVVGILKILIKGDNKGTPKRPEVRPLINAEREDIKYGTETDT